MTGEKRTQTARRVAGAASRGTCPRGGSELLEGTGALPDARHEIPAYSGSATPRWATSSLATEWRTATRSCAAWAGASWGCTALPGFGWLAKRILRVIGRGRAAVCRARWEAISAGASQPRPERPGMAGLVGFKPAWKAGSMRTRASCARSHPNGESWRSPLPASGRTPLAVIVVCTSRGRQAVGATSSTRTLGDGARPQTGLSPTSRSHAPA